MRLHHQLRRRTRRRGSATRPTQTAWTEVPGGPRLAALATDPLARRPDRQPAAAPGMLGRRYGAIGLLALPYTIGFEVVGAAAPGGRLTGMLIGDARLLAWLCLVVRGRGRRSSRSCRASSRRPGRCSIEEVGYRRYRTRDLWSIAALEPPRAVLVPAPHRRSGGPGQPCSPSLVGRRRVGIDSRGAALGTGRMAKLGSVPLPLPR